MIRYLCKKNYIDNNSKTRINYSDVVCVKFVNGDPVITKVVLKECNIRLSKEDLDDNFVLYDNVE